MARIKVPHLVTMASKSKELLELVNRRLGMISNMHQHMALSPTVLEAYINIGTSVSNISLEDKIRECIALAVSEKNKCEYCVSAHSVRASRIGLSPDAIKKARSGKARDPKANAAVKLALASIEKNGKVSEEDIAKAKDKGVSDKEIVEVIALACFTLFTNYFNLALQPEMDFPRVELL